MAQRRSPTTPNKETPEQLRARLLREHAERLGISEQAFEKSLQDTPGSAEADAQEAARQGRTVEQLRADDRRAMEAYAYPGPDCLDIGDIAAHARGEALEAGLLEHAQTCQFCAGLLDLSTAPSPAHAVEFTATLREEQARHRLLQAAADRSSTSPYMPREEVEEADAEHELMAASSHLPPSSKAALRRRDADGKR
jgi:hypothetical protein